MSKTAAKFLALSGIVSATVMILLFGIYLPEEILGVAATAAATVLSFVFVAAVGAVITFILATIIIITIVIIAGDMAKRMTPTIPMLATGVGAYAASAMAVAAVSFAIGIIPFAIGAIATFAVVTTGLVYETINAHYTRKGK